MRNYFQPTLVLSTSLFLLFTHVHALSPLPCRNYTSVEGDTCWSIAKVFKSDPISIYYANQYLDCSDIWPNSVICIPTPRPECDLHYRSKQGDTCSSIGDKYGLAGDKILNANEYLNCKDIWTNTNICIPKGWKDGGGSPQQCLRTYISKPGDSCGSIGRAHGMTAAQVLASNSHLNCADVWTGSPICITTEADADAATLPSDCKAVYISAPGDTCRKIEQKFNLYHGALQTVPYNSFINCDDIWDETQICVPINGLVRCDWGWMAENQLSCGATGVQRDGISDQVQYWGEFHNCLDILQYPSFCVGT